jgi:hypothetical protein
VLVNIFYLVTCPHPPPQPSPSSPVHSSRDELSIPGVVLWPSELRPWLRAQCHRGELRPLLLSLSIRRTSLSSIYCRTSSSVLPPSLASSAHSRTPIPACSSPVVASPGYDGGRRWSSLRRRGRTWRPWQRAPSLSQRVELSAPTTSSRAPRLRRCKSWCLVLELRPQVVMARPQTASFDRLCHAGVTSSIVDP